MLIFISTIIAIILPQHANSKIYLIETVDKSVENTINPNAQKSNIIDKSKKRRSAAIKNVGATFNPRFVEPINNMTVDMGNDATFTCVVSQIEGYRVGWVKADTNAILATGTQIFTHNPRISVSHDKSQRRWMLHITRTKLEDTGSYMCELNTDPFKSQVVFLDVVIPQDIGDCQHKKGNGKDYVGSVSKTKSGLTCQAWSSQSPHKHEYAHLGHHNFCRNTDGFLGVWCYTTSQKLWEFCDVPVCGSTCTCNGRISKESQGVCQNSYNGGKFCYVNEGECEDQQKSKIPGWFWSHQACKEFTQFARDALEEHNILRQTPPHNATKLTLDQQLCRDAQEYADYLSDTDIFDHDPSAQGKNEGENIAWTKELRNGKDIVLLWYNEKVTGQQCEGHYTQVVWKVSTKFCMTKSKNMSRTNKFYIVARYSPKGNVVGYEQEYVYPGYHRPTHFIDDNGKKHGSCASLEC